MRKQRWELLYKTKKRNHHKDPNNPDYLRIVLRKPSTQKKTCNLWILQSTIYNNSTSKQHKYPPVEGWIKMAHDIELNVFLSHKQKK